jgi:hypothetical protein
MNCGYVCGRMAEWHGWAEEVQRFDNGKREAVINA